MPRVPAAADRHLGCRFFRGQTLGIGLILIGSLASPTWALPEDDIPIALKAAVLDARLQRENIFWPTIFTTGLLATRLAIDGEAFTLVPLYDNTSLAEVVDLGAFGFGSLCFSIFTTHSPSLEEQTLDALQSDRISMVQYQDRVPGLKLAGILDRLVKAALSWGLTYYFATTHTGSTLTLDYAMSWYFFNVGLRNFRDPSPAEKHL